MLLIGILFQRGDGGERLKDKGIEKDSWQSAVFSRSLHYVSLIWQWSVLRKRYKTKENKGVIRRGFYLLDN